MEMKVNEGNGKRKKTRESGKKQDGRSGKERESRGEWEGG